MSDIYPNLKRKNKLIKVYNNAEFLKIEKTGEKRKHSYALFVYYL